MFSNFYTILFCGLLFINTGTVLAFDSTRVISDSIAFRYPSRPPISLTAGFGAVIFTGDVKKAEPVYNKYYASSGFLLNISGSIPIPKTRFLGINFHCFNLLSSDENICSWGWDDDNAWLQFDLNGQYGVQDYFDNSLLYTDYISMGYLYELRNTITIGPALWLPLAKHKRIFFYLAPLFGRGKFVHGEYERTIEETFLFSNSTPVYKAVTVEQIKTVPVSEMTAGFFFSTGKRFVLSFNMTKINTPNVDWRVVTRFYVNQVFKEENIRNHSTRLQAYTISINAGLRF